MPSFVVNEKGKRESVVLGIREYERLLKQIEDLQDALELDEAVQRAKSFRDYTAIRAELRKSGHL